MYNSPYPAHEQGEEGTDDFAVLVAYGIAADAKCTVYDATQKSVKFVQHEIYSAQSGDFLIFYAIFAMLVEVLLTCFCTTKVSEISDMAKSRATYCCSGTYK